MLSLHDFEINIKFQVLDVDVGSDLKSKLVFYFLNKG